MAEKEASAKKSVPREYLESVVVAVILALFIRTFAVQAFKIPTGSMETNLLIGDHLLFNTLVYWPYEATRDEYHRTDAVDWVRDTVSAFGKTRWERFFHLIR